jgi:plastocyanin
MRKIPLLLAVLALTGTAACSSDDDSGTPSPRTVTTTSAAPSPTGGPSARPAAEIRALPGKQFSPTTVTLKAGESVLVRDADPNLPHNFTVDGVGHSDTLSNGETFTLVFPKAGTYTFVCTFHEGMEGTITVS